MAVIAVTGGTGFVGMHLAQTLSRAGHELRLVARGSRTGPRPAGATFVRANVVRGEGLVDAFRGCDAVVHLTAVIVERRDQTFDAVNRGGAENVARAARQAGVAHLVHMSALGVDPDPAFPYLATKWEGEMAARGCGVPCTVLRPSIIFGPGDGFFTRLTRLIRLNPVIPIAGDGRAMFQPLAVQDVSRIIQQCVEGPPPRENRIAEVGGPDHLSYEQIIDTIRAELGVRRMKGHVPIPAMLPLAFLFEKVLPNPPVTPGQLKLLQKQNITRLDSVERQFGFRPRALAGNIDYLHDY